ncbi:hypothetical protein HanLR1_Chr01g0030031 [Helianthus annuus]|nr:hypothetical protein HanHA89_Chr01g0031501 [Helianthus annuus]KAJ0784245.1 hypothetical protein HanLR1_Chr01g0030031 [Helianthus annuus]
MLNVMLNVSEDTRDYSTCASNASKGSEDTMNDSTHAYGVRARLKVLTKLM